MSLAGVCFHSQLQVQALALSCCEQQKGHGPPARSMKNLTVAPS